MYRRSDWLQNILGALSGTMVQSLFQEIDALVVNEEDGAQLLEIMVNATSDFEIWTRMRDYKCKQPLISFKDFTTCFQDSPRVAITVLYKYLCPPSAISFIQKNSITPEELYYFHLDNPNLHPLRAISEILLHKK